MIIATFDLDVDEFNGLVLTHPDTNVVDWREIDDDEITRLIVEAGGIDEV